MNTQDLRSRLRLLWSGYGSYKVVLRYRNKSFYCLSNNSLAYDRITGYANVVTDRTVKDSYTFKGALKAFYDECKSVNGL